MSDLKLCRICLNIQVKLYKYDSYYLKQYYEEVMAIRMNMKDGLPHHFCYECASMLHKFHKFREKCYTGQQVLRELLWKGPITLKSIANIDRDSNNLKSPLDIIIVNKKVRTNLIKSKTVHISLDKKNNHNEIEKSCNIEEIKLPKIEEVEMDIDSDDSSDNKNLAQYKNEITEKENLRNDSTNVMNDDGKESNEMNDSNIDDIIRMSDDDEISNSEIENTAITDRNLYKEAIGEKKTEINDNKIKSKGNRSKKNKENKLKKFEVKSKNYLDPEHWLKIILSEEEAVEEFEARAQDPKYLTAAYKCTDCYKGFSQEDMLNRHKKLRHSESLGQIVCRFCSMRFKWKCYLTRHISQHYTKYKCLRCELMCPLESTAIFHNDYHNGVIRKCMHCDLEFRHLSTYYTHLRTHRSEHVCTLCGASFVSPIGLGIHKRTMHINTVINPEEDVNTHCEQCDVKFETRKAYEEHVFHSAKHTEGIEEIANQVLAEPKMNPKRRKKDFRRNPRKFTTCSICNKNFSSYTAYLKHHALEHKNVAIPKVNARHICEICGASLASGSVVSHLNTHTRVKLHTCQVCGMQFNTKGSMIRHQRTHTGEKPYSCSLCDKRFTQRSSMKLHYRTFHLKEPYPKRNRKKKTSNTQDCSALEDYHNVDSEENSKIVGWR